MKEFTKNTFDEEVLNSKKPVLVDFWATWCGPCKMLSPIIEELSNELGDKVLIGKVNVDDEGELAIKYGIVSIPTVMLFKDGKVLETVIGYRTKQQLLDILSDVNFI